MLAFTALTTRMAETAKVRASVYLTFDDGPYPATAEVLDALRAGGVKATFFLCAKNLERDTELQYKLVKRMISEGHSLGNHGYDHDPMTKPVEHRLSRRTSPTTPISSTSSLSDTRTRFPAFR
jgi:peptidoglycan/xylan/chitin deacetylase (PgdA/CDA1 family)